jgi:hypothetical protein
MHYIRFVSALTLLAGISLAQFQFGVVCTTDAQFALYPNSSHRLGARDELVGLPGDTVYLVYHNSQAAWIRTGMFGGDVNWGPPTLLDTGGFAPAIDCRPDGHRYVVWMKVDSTGWGQVYFRDLDTAMSAVRLSDPPYSGTVPDVYCDDLGRAHIVWLESDDDSSTIVYRSWYNGVLSSPVVLEAIPGYDGDYGPSISCFNAGDIYVTWLSYDSSLASPWSIKRRRLVGGQWQPVELVWHSARELAAPSLDFGRGLDEAPGMCWAESTAGGFDPHYFGGNGGGYSTRWQASYPVVSNLGTVWSYLFWEDDSEDVSDIRTHFYYFMNGWDAGYSIRQFFGIDENVWHPTCLGALVLWVQGEPPDYRVMYAYFDYPIGVAETPPGRLSRRLSVQPNPVRAHATVASPGPVSVFDRSGRLVQSAIDNRQSTIDLDLSSLPAGVYVIRSGAASATVIKQ